MDATSAVTCRRWTQTRAGGRATAWRSISLLSRYALVRAARLRRRRACPPFTSPKRGRLAVFDDDERKVVGLCRGGSTIAHDCLADQLRTVFFHPRYGVLQLNLGIGR